MVLTAALTSLGTTSPRYNRAQATVNKNQVNDSHITTKQGDRPTVFALPGITLDHLVATFETSEGHLGNRVLFMGSLFFGDDRSVGSEREMNTGETKRVERHISIQHGITMNSLWLLTEPSWSGIRSSQR